MKEELLNACRGDKDLLKWNFNDHTAYIFVVPHPSGRNPLAQIFYDLAKDYLTSLINTIL